MIDVKAQQLFNKFMADQYVWEEDIRSDVAMEEDGNPTEEEQGYNAKSKALRIEEIRAGWKQVAEHCKSPIEQQLLAAMIWMDTSYGMQDAPMEIFAGGFDRYPGDEFIVAHYPIGQFEVDFAVFVKGFWSNPLMLAVECDGHDYHRKTKGQARYDYKRDRWLMSMGWQIMRFTGSEIWRDPVACAEEVGNFISDFFETGIPGGRDFRRRWKDNGFTPPHKFGVDIPGLCEYVIEKEKEKYNGWFSY